MTVLFCFVVGLFGLLLGGFVGRASYALPRGEYKEIFCPRCPSCGRSYPSFVVIPVVGAFLAARRCPHCGEKRSRATILAEWILAAAFVLLYLRFDFSYLFFIYGVLAVDLLLLALIDSDIKEVPHSLLLVILLLGVMSFVFSFFSFSRTGTIWWEHIVGAFAVSLPLFVVMMITGGAVGGGDIKLLFCLGLLLGYKLVLFAFLVGVVLAALVGVVFLLLFGKSGRFRLPLVPFLSLGALVSVLCGNTVISLLFR